MMEIAKPYQVTWQEYPEENRGYEYSARQLAFSEKQAEQIVRSAYKIDPAIPVQVQHATGESIYWQVTPLQQVGNGR